MTKTFLYIGPAARIRVGELTLTKDEPFTTDDPKQIRLLTDAGLAAPEETETKPEKKKHSRKVDAEQS